MRTVTVERPSELASSRGIAYALWLPRANRGAGGAAANRGLDGALAGRRVTGAVIILHGAASAKESHYDFARAALATGLAAISFDLRGHGASRGPMDGHVLEDIEAMAALVRERLGDPDAPLVLRGSSMGGYLAILAAARLDARAVVAICPASAEGLSRGLRAGNLAFDADVPALDAFLAEHDPSSAVAQLSAPLLLLHAEGDERVPVEHSRQLASLVAHPASRLIVVPGGHHRSIQHDVDMQAVSLRFIAQTLGG